MGSIYDFLVRFLIFVFTLVPALSMIVRKIPNVLPKFEDMLDQAITLAEHDINDVDCELKLDFRVLVPNQVSTFATFY